MKTCKRCFREFEEPEVDVVDVNPARELGSCPRGKKKRGTGPNFITYDIW